MHVVLPVTRSNPLILPLLSQLVRHSFSRLPIRARRISIYPPGLHGCTVGLNTVVWRYIGPSAELSLKWFTVVGIFLHCDLG